MARLANQMSIRLKEQVRHFATAGDMSAQLFMQSFGNGIMDGSGFVTDPTTANAQVTGAGATTWNADVAHMLANFHGSISELAKQTNVSIHSGSQLMPAGQSVVASLALKKAANGVLSIVPVKGAAAATGTAVAPSDATIQAAVGAGLDWVKLADVQLDRTADTTLVATYFNFRGDRGIFGVSYP